MLTKNILKQWQVVRSQVKKRLYVLFENNVNQLEIRSGPTITESKKMMPQSESKSYTIPSASLLCSSIFYTYYTTYFSY